MAQGGSKLQVEIQQRSPFRSRGQEAYLGILRTADVLRRYSTRMFEPYGLTAQQYNVLRILRGAGAAGIPTLAIAERLIEETPGMTRLLDRMESKGWVLRHRCPRDRRQVLCTITQPGLDLLARLDPVVNAADSEVTGVFSESELDMLIGFLDRIRRQEPQTD